MYRLGLITVLVLVPMVGDGQSIKYYPDTSGSYTLGPESSLSIRYWPATLRNGLQSYYLMGEVTGATRNDSIGGKHLLDGLGSVVQVAGKSGNAAQTSAAATNYLHGSDFVLGVSWTMSLWWNNNDAGRSTDNIFSIVQAWPNNTQVAVYFGTDTQAYALVGDGAAFSFASSATGAIDGNWHHTIAWFSAADKIVHISVDGGAESAGAIALAGTPYRGLSKIGTGSSLGPAASNAIVDEVAIWSRVLSPAERAIMYGAGVGKFYPF